MFQVKAGFEEKLSKLAKQSLKYAKIHPIDQQTSAHHLKNSGGQRTAAEPKRDLCDDVEDLAKKARIVGHQRPAFDNRPEAAARETEWGRA